MTWFRVDDGFWSHPKTLGLSDAAIALWVRAGAYASQHLTDGVIPAVALRMLGERAAADELVNSELWDIAPGGYVFHDWEEYQETSVAVKDRRAAARDRQRKSRAARSGKPAVEKPDSEDVTGPVTRDEPCDIPGDITREFATPDPTRPDLEENTFSSAMPPKQEEPRRADVEALCDRLCDLVIENGSRAKVTDTWRREARLMLDRDGREFDKAMRLIEWCQADTFWRTNVLSMSKFRAKYDQLRLKANEQLVRRPSNPSSVSSMTTREQRFVEAELLKDNPNPEVLRRAGINPDQHLRAIAGGQR